MQAKGRVNYEELYKNMKRDYDELLEKSQNDLIKIKIREKQLNDRIASIQKEKDLLEKTLKAEIQELKYQLGQPKETISPGKQKSAKEVNLIISAKDDQIAKLKHKILALGDTASSEKYVLLALQGQLQELKSELANLKRLNEKNSQQSKIKAEKHSKTEQNLQKQLIELKEKNKQLRNNAIQKTLFDQSERKKRQTQENNLRDRLQIISESLDREKNKVQELQTQLKWKQDELVKFKTLVEEKIKTMQQKQCQKCLDLAQQVQLHQQMLRSVKMMLKFKEMELQKYAK